MAYKGYAFENRVESAQWMAEGEVKRMAEVPYARGLAHTFYDYGWQDRAHEIDALNELIGRLRETAIRVCEVRGRPHPTDRTPMMLAVTALGHALADLGWEGWDR